MVSSDRTRPKYSKNEGIEKVPSFFNFSKKCTERQDKQNNLCYNKRKTETGMYNGIEKIEAIIEEIEEKITEVIDYEALAAHMTLSVYEFRRIFAFIVGCHGEDHLGY